MSSLRRDGAAERADYVVCGQPRIPCDLATEAVLRLDEEA